MRKKLVLLLLVLGVSLLAATQWSFAQKTKLVLGGHTETMITYEGEQTGQWALLVREFNKEHPDIEVEYNAIAPGGRSMEDIVITMLRARADTYDVYTADVFWPSLFLAREWLTPVEEVFPEEEWQDFVPAMIDSFRSDGHIYGVPFMNDFRILVYRKDLLEEAGIEPPDTWMDLIDAAVKLQDPPNLFGYCGDWGVHPDTDWQGMFWSNGGVQWTDTHVTLNSPEGIEALQLMVDMNNSYQILEPGATTISYAGAQRIFIEGKAVFHQGWLSTYTNSQKEGSKVIGKVGILRLPRFKKSSPENVESTLGGWSWVINPNTKKKDAALELVEWLSKKETLKWITLNWSGIAPARLSLYRDSDVLEKYPPFTMLADLVPYTRVRCPDYPFHTQWFDTARAEIPRAIEGKKTAKEALDTIAEAVSEWAELPLKYPVE